MSGATFRFVQRPLEPEDAPAVLAAFRAAFGHERDPSEHAWRFHANPAGTRARVAWDGDRVAAMVAALPVRGWRDGAPLTLAQGVDTFVHPYHRRGLVQRGLLARVGEAFFSGLSGDVAFCFGWPIPAYRRVGSRLFGFESLGRQAALVREGTLARAPQRGVVRDPGFDERVTWLGERCLASWGVAALRDETWFRWRYQDRPLRAYRTLAVEPSTPGGAFEALAVWRPVAWGATTVAAIVDWLVPEGETGPADALLAAVDADVRAAGLDTLALWMPAWSRWFDWFTDQGFHLSPTDPELVVRVDHPAIDPIDLRERWWYQLGDSDLV